jgi:hypothetical protein
MLLSCIAALIILLTLFVILFKKSKDRDAGSDNEQQPTIVNTNNIKIFYPIKFNNKFIKYHKFEKSSFISIKHKAKRVQITDPLFPGDDRERRSIYETVEVYFKISSDIQINTVKELNMLNELPSLSIEYYTCDEVKHLVKITKSVQSQSLPEMLTEIYPNDDWEF